MVIGANAENVLYMVRPIVGRSQWPDVVRLRVEPSIRQLYPLSAYLTTKAVEPLDARGQLCVAYDALNGGGSPGTWSSREFIVCRNSDSLLQQPETILRVRRGAGPVHAVAAFSRCQLMFGPPLPQIGNRASEDLRVLRERAPPSPTLPVRASEVEAWRTVYQRLCDVYIQEEPRRVRPSPGLKECVGVLLEAVIKNSKTDHSFVCG